MEKRAHSVNQSKRFGSNVWIFGEFGRRAVQNFLFRRFDLENTAFGSLG